MTVIRHLTVLAASLALGLPAVAHAAPQQSQTVAVTTPMSVPGTAPLTQFAPRPTKRTRIDYQVWDEALKELVLYGGPSLRMRARKPEPFLGSRVTYGHTSPFRNEGNKVVFEYLNDDFKTVLDDYAKDLIRIGNDVDIPALSRNEQLAYWLNLHNVLIMREIAARYRIDKPSIIRGWDGKRLHDTQVAEIDGVELSLRDIRERIVYPNWRDSRVIYGFWLGELGGPSIQRAAFDGPSVWNTLGVAADEFANSLRGVERRGTTLRVSKIYEDVAPWYFPDFERDVRAHLARFANDMTRIDLEEAEGGRFKVALYENVIADLTAGDGEKEPLSNTESFAGGAFGNANTFNTIDRAIIEQKQKFNELRERGLTGTVIIEDIEPEYDAEENVPEP